jgi:hypothetical protein
MSGLVAYESCDTLPAGWIGDTACPSAAGIDMASTESVSSPFSNGFLSHVPAMS